MSARTEQTAAQPVLKKPVPRDLPTVTVDERSRVITVEVFVARPKGASAFTISAPLVTIPFLGSWTLVWELSVLTAGLKAHFADPGIVLPKTLPQKTTIVTGPTGTWAQWTVQLENGAREVTSFNYDIAIKSSMSTGRMQAQIDLRHDAPPTEVTKVPDPVDPPRPQLL